jgi:hypothetical protein
VEQAPASTSKKVQMVMILLDTDKVNAGIPTGFWQFTAMVQTFIMRGHSLRRAHL